MVTFQLLVYIRAECMCSLFSGTDNKYLLDMVVYTNTKTLELFSQNARQNLQKFIIVGK